MVLLQASFGWYTSSAFLLARPEGGETARRLFVLRLNQSDMEVIQAMPLDPSVTDITTPKWSNDSRNRRLVKGWQLLDNCQSEGVHEHDDSDDQTNIQLHLKIESVC